MRKIRYLLLICILAQFVSSCSTKTNINYMENIQKIALETSKENAVSTIQPGDLFVILVSAKDNNVAKPFNQNYSSTESSIFSNPSTNVPQPQSTISGPTYTVSTKNTIDFPILGEFETKDKTMEDLKSEIQQKLKKYIKDPTVSIRMLNFKISVLGEVVKAGRYTVPDGQALSLLDALAMAGDLTIYGEREKILLLRNVDGKTTSNLIDITKADFINSPYYYLKQNDILFVSANKTRQNASKFGPQTAVWISVASVALGLLALFINKK
jgi:polysaccharide export outer membrane protein